MKHRLIWITTLTLLVAACSLTVEPSPPPTALPVTAPSNTPVSHRLPEPSPLIHTNTGPYANQTALLDGVCFEYLASRAPVTWTWNSGSELAAFFDEVDNSKLCPTPITRTTFNFSDYLLLGAVQTARGCDAAYVVTAGTLIESAAVVLQARLIVQPGCPYELVEPLVIAVLRPPKDTSLMLTLEPSP